ncbi:hypothetical protein [Natronosalvus rutilus]|uniref:DUF8050 domain-containing protein n=1 Tax=Natronosalvus rutilus TaxID=2953753 RepID=A0A9E7NDG4_9EURY|nr:hypothetical protein [Natronosalvus rutilus]UTF54950.1 hypothetical protein NGM29_06760 [Natronosalvus rutilus]
MASVDESNEPDESNKSDDVGDNTSPKSQTDGRKRRDRIVRWLALLSLGVVPWVVIRTSGTTLLFPWGTIVLETEHVTLLPTFLDQPGPTPSFLRYWPLGSLAYALALCWAGARAVGLPADRRVTAGLLALVGVAAIGLSAGFGVDPNRTAYPLATIHAPLVAGWLWLSGAPRADE